MNNELLAQLSLAFYLGRPSEAKNSKALVFGEMYDKIFDEHTVTAQRLLIPLMFYQPLQEIKRQIQRKKRRKEPIDEREAFVSRAIFHILYAVSIIAESEQLDLVESNVKLLTDKAIQQIGSVVRLEQKKRGGLYTHDKFFKESQTNIIIQEHLKAHYFKNTNPLSKGKGV